MGAPVAGILTDNVSATFTPVSTDYERFPGSTLFEGYMGGKEFMRPEPGNTTGVQMVTGYQGKGTWGVSWCGSFTASVGNRVYHISLFHNGAKVKQTSRERKIGTAGDVGSAAGSGHIVMNASTDVLDFRVKSTIAAKITFTHLSFKAELLSTSTVLSVIT
jgi:hypothetical protein